MNDFDPAGYIEAQRAGWNSVAQGWEKWDEWLDSSMSACDAALLERAGLEEGNKVLDLGCGSGHPAIPAAMKIGDRGHVTGLDLSEKMLEVARKKAERAGLANTAFHACDVSRVPFEDESFDAVTSRFCLMFLPDPDGAIKEARRVLKSGGRIATAVWAGMEKNPSLSMPMEILNEFADASPASPSAPGLFSLGAPGDLKSRMKNAGVSDVREEELVIEWVYASGREYVRMLVDMAAPVRSLLDKLDGRERTEAEERIAKTVESRFGHGDRVRVPCVAVVVSGTKGAA